MHNNIIIPARSVVGDRWALCRHDNNIIVMFSILLNTRINLVSVATYMYVQTPQPTVYTIHIPGYHITCMFMVMSIGDICQL